MKQESEKADVLSRIQRNMASQEVCFSLGEKSDRMLTVTPFNGNVKVHIRQFYTNENGEKKACKSGIALSVEEFGEMVKLIPKVQENIARYELRDTGISSIPFPVIKEEPFCSDLDCVFLPSPPSQDPTPFPLIQDNWFSPCDPHQLKLPTSTLPDISPLIEPNLEKILDDLRVSEKPKEKRKRAKGITKSNGKRKRKTDVKRQCIDEVATVEGMKEVEQKLWLEHYNQKKEIELMKYLPHTLLFCSGI